MPRSDWSVSPSQSRSPAAEERGIDLALPKRNEVWGDGDDGRLRQMISDLLDNAIKFTPVGGSVRVALIASNGVAELTVRDTGVGIAPEHLLYVFDCFYRADRARARAGRGVGLGLSICRTIAEAHGGSMGIISEPGKGTTVVVRLPSIPGEPESGDETPARPTGADGQ